MRPRVPEDSDFGRLIMTVVSAAGVAGGSFRMHGFVGGDRLVVGGSFWMRGFVGGEKLDFGKLFNAGWAFG